MYYVTDTHAFLWYLSDSPKLSQKARAIFDSCDRGEVTVIVSAVVLLEAMDILDKRKVALNFDDKQGSEVWKLKNKGFLTFACSGCRFLLPGRPVSGGEKLVCRTFRTSHICLS